MELGRLAAELEEARNAAAEAERRLAELLGRLPLRKGCTLDYRWVRGNGGRYWYWYAVCYSGGRRYHVYLGKGIDPRVWDAITRSRSAAEVGSEVARRHREALRLIARARRLEGKALALLEEALQLYERAALLYDEGLEDLVARALRRGEEVVANA